MQCARCKTRLDPADTATPSYNHALRAILKDWRLWVLALVLTLVAGATAGALHLPPGGFAAGTGAAIGVFVHFRARTMRKCPRCGATFQSAPFWGRSKTG